MALLLTLIVTAEFTVSLFPLPVICIRKYICLSRLFVDATAKALHDNGYKLMLAQSFGSVFQHQTPSIFFTRFESGLLMSLFVVPPPTRNSCSWHLLICLSFFCRLYIPLWILLVVMLITYIYIVLKLRDEVSSIDCILIIYRGVVNILAFFV